MTYTSTTLKQAIQDFVENDETTFVGNLDNFIRNTEERLLKLVDLDYFRKNVSVNRTYIYSCLYTNHYMSLPVHHVAL